MPEDKRVQIRRNDAFVSGTSTIISRWIMSVMKWSDRSVFKQKLYSILFPFGLSETEISPRSRLGLRAGLLCKCKCPYYPCKLASDACHYISGSRLDIALFALTGSGNSCPGMYRVKRSVCRRTLDARNQLNRAGLVEICLLPAY